MVSGGRISPTDYTEDDSLSGCRHAGQGAIHCDDSHFFLSVRRSSRCDGSPDLHRLRSCHILLRSHWQSMSGKYTL